MQLRPIHPALRKRQRGYFVINPYAAGGSGVPDPAFTTVVQLAHFDGFDGQNGLMTNSCPRGNQINIAGANGQLSSAQYVFGGTSMRQTGGPFSCPTAHADYQFTTYDWTVEFRFRTDSVVQKNIFDLRDTVGVTATLTMYTYADGRLGFYTHGAERIVSSAGAITATTWYAIAASRVSGTTRLFINGTQVGSSYTDGNNYNGTSRISSAVTAFLTNANWDELRVSNGAFGAGAGRYAANYAPAAFAFPNS